MSDENKTKNQLIDELNQLRGRAAALEEEAAASGEAGDAKRERDRLRAILTTAIECLPFEFFAIGTDGRYIYENAIAREHYGGIGKCPEECTSDEATRALWLDNNRRAFAGQRVEGEVEMCVGGEMRHYYNVITPVRDADQFYGILGVNVDITKRKMTEEALKQAHAALEQRVKERTTELLKANDQLQHELIQRRRVEEQLLRAKRQWERTFDSVPDPILILDTEYRIVQANRPMAQRLGRTADQCVGLTCFESIHGRSEPVDSCPHARTLADRQEHTVEIREERLGGDFLVSTSPLLDDHGELLGSVHVAHDITKRKETEEALRLSEQKYKTLLETCPDVVLTLDPAGRILFASQQMWKLLSFSDSEELVGRSILDFADESDRGKLAANIADLAKVGMRKNTEYTLHRPDGTKVPIETSSTVMRDAGGRITAILAVIRDITSRKKAEATLRQHYDQLQTIYDGMIEGLAIVDIETKRLLRVNSSLCRMLGYSEEELLKASLQDIHPPEDVPNDLRRFQATAEGRVSINEARPILRKDGCIFYADITGRRILYEGEPCLLALFRDVTERRQTQAALQRERRTLKHMLRASDHERQLIAYDIHDGLAQQLAAAIMQFQTYDLLKQADSEEARKAYDGGVALLRQGHFEARRLISGVRPPILDESGVVAAIGHLVNEESLKGEPQIVFHSNVAFNRLAPVLENVIYRIVQESLTNACKHSRSELVRVTLLQLGDRLHVEVRDWGVGFDPKKAQTNRFGLSGIRQRARLLGGKCRIQSKPNRGTRITIELPVAEEGTD